MWSRRDGGGGEGEGRVCISIGRILEERLRATCLRLSIAGWKGTVCTISTHPAEVKDKNPKKMKKWNIFTARDRTSFTKLTSSKLLTYRHHIRGVQLKRPLSKLNSDLSDAVDSTFSKVLCRKLSPGPFQTSTNLHVLSQCLN
jgi:hypothetical protein